MFVSCFLTWSHYDICGFKYHLEGLMWHAAFSDWLLSPSEMESVQLPLCLHGWCRKPFRSLHGLRVKIWCFEATLPCGSSSSLSQMLKHYLLRHYLWVHSWRTDFPGPGSLPWEVSLHQRGYWLTTYPDPYLLPYLLPGHQKAWLHTWPVKPSPTSEANSPVCLVGSDSPLQRPCHAVCLLCWSELSLEPPPWPLSVCLSMTLITFIINSVFSGNRSQCPSWVSLWNLSVWHFFSVLSSILLYGCIKVCLSCWRTSCLLYVWVL